MEGCWGRSFRVVEIGACMALSISAVIVLVVL